MTFLFDWDGCLVDTSTAWLNIYRDVFNKFDLNISDFEIGNKVIPNWRGFVLEYKLDAYQAEIMDMISAGRRELWKADLVEGAFEVITRLHESGNKLAIVTNYMPSSSDVSQTRLGKALDYHDLTSKFEVVIHGRDVTNPKPDPEMLNLAMNKLDSDPSDSWMIGDDLTDVVAGRNAGVSTIAFHNPDFHSTFHNLEMIRSANPDKIISQLSEILEIK